MAGRLITVLDMRPSTTNNLTSNKDQKFTAHQTIHYYMGTILDPKLTSQYRKQAQIPVDTTTGLLHIHPL